MSQTLKLYLPKVLSENKVVLLKGIGTLRINYRPAVINPDLSVIIPPKEEIYFVPTDEAKIDPVLVKIVQLVTSVDREEATDLVYRFMKDLQFELRSKNQVFLPGLGNIKQDQWGGIFFEPSAEYIAIDRFFGFGQVSLPEALTKAEQEVLADLKETVHEGATTRILGGSSSKRKWGFVIRSILVLLAMTGLIFLAQYLWQGDRDTVELPSPGDGDSAYVLNTGVYDQLRQVGPHFLPGRTKAQPLDSVIDSAPTEEKTCLIIVGAFLQQGNVEKMLRRIEEKGGEAEIIVGNRLTKVGMKVVCGEDSAEKLKWAKKELDANAWILHK